MLPVINAARANRTTGDRRGASPPRQFATARRSAACANYRAAACRGWLLRRRRRRRARWARCRRGTPRPACSTPGRRRRAGRSPCRCAGRRRRAAARSPWSGGRPSALAMKSAQIGAAVLPPASPRPSFFMSSKPTHTAASRSGVKPTNQASRWPFEVPVLPAAGRRSLPATARVRGPLVDHAAHQRHHDVGDLGLQRRAPAAPAAAPRRPARGSTPAARRCRRWRTSRRRSPAPAASPPAIRAPATARRRSRSAT